MFSWDGISIDFIREDGEVNAAFETIDRHVEERYGDKIALHFVNEEERKTYTLQELI